MHTHVLPNQSGPPPDTQRIQALITESAVEKLGLFIGGRRMRSYCLKPELLMALSQGFLEVKIDSGGL